MRTIVTGAAGFLGYHLCRRLLDAGHDVHGFDSMTTGSDANAADLSKLKRFTFTRQDICVPLKIEGSIDRIYNMACPASPVDFHDKAVEIMLTCSVGMKTCLIWPRQVRDDFAGLDQRVLR
jgi:UDP-glucuronate decarboxylase